MQEMISNGQGGSLALILAAVLTLIQIAPIKINPWSWLATHIGRALNHEVMTEVKGIKAEQAKASEEAAKQWAILARTHILRFDDELYNGVKHSKEYFMQQLADIDTYEDYCQKHPDFRNSSAMIAIEHIKQTYARCLAEHKFI